MFALLMRFQVGDSRRYGHLTVGLQPYISKLGFATLNIFLEGMYKTIHPLLVRKREFAESVPITQPVFSSKGANDIKLSQLRRTYELPASR